jgi:hypothetical protein
VEALQSSTAAAIWRQSTPSPPPQVGPCQPQPDGSAVVPAQVVGSKSGQPFSVVFTLVQRELGRKKGCWMTKSLVRAEQ